MTEKQQKTQPNDFSIADYMRVAGPRGSWFELPRSKMERFKHEASLLDYSMLQRRYERFQVR